MSTGPGSEGMVRGSQGPTTEVLRARDEGKDGVGQSEKEMGGNILVP